MWEWDSSSIIILLLLYLKQKKLPIFLISAPADQSSFPKSLLPCPESETDLRKFWKALCIRRKWFSGSKLSIAFHTKVTIYQSCFIALYFILEYNQNVYRAEAILTIGLFICKHPLLITKFGNFLKRNGISRWSGPLYMY